jgi:CRP-like cAMP-binding protein
MDQGDLLADADTNESIGKNTIWYWKKSRPVGDVPVGHNAGNVDTLVMETVPNRATLFDQGVARNGVYLIKNGRVRITRETADGKDVTIALLGPGDLFDEHALFGEIGRPTSAKCLEETVICKAFGGNLLELLATSPELATKVTQLLSHRVNDPSAGETRAAARPQNDPDS